MRLEWVRLGGGVGRKYLLILRLGEQGGRVAYLDTSKVPSQEVPIIRGSMPRLAQLSLEERTVWLKRACPVSYRLAYRKVTASSLAVLKEY